LLNSPDPVYKYLQTIGNPVIIIDFFARFVIIYAYANAIIMRLAQRSDFVVSREVTVTCESGLHNKQATYFVQKANDYVSTIRIEMDSRTMNAKSLLGIISMRIVPGMKVTLHADGPDAECAVDALEALLLRDVS